MARFFISVDAEGMPYSPYRGMMMPGDPLYGELRRIMAWIVDVVVSEIRAGSPRAEIVVADSHGAMVNLDPFQAREDYVLVRGFPRPLAMVYGAEGADAAMMLGYHSSQQAGGVLGHTYAGRIVQRVTVSGFTAASELVLNAYALGEMGVPVVLVAGDEALRADAERVAPDAVFVALKKPASSLADVTPPRRTVEEALRRGVREALSKLGEARPSKPEAPEITVEFKRPWHADLAQLFPCVERLDGVTVRLRCESYLNNYRLFEGLVMAAYSLERR